VNTEEEQEQEQEQEVYVDGNGNVTADPEFVGEFGSWGAIR
jgi:hypothetical protein